MPSPGLSLLGFMTEKQAAYHLKTHCILPDESDNAILAELSAAKAKIGSPIPNAGHADIQPFPDAGRSYANKVLQQP